MFSDRQVRRALLAILFVALVAGASSRVTLDAQAGLQVIATGLDNPRGLGFGPDGALYVAEAGRGGSSGLCVPQPDAPPGTIRCYGPSGAVTRVLAVGDQRRVVVGLPSLAVASGEGATGPHDIGFGLGNVWVTVGFGGNPASRAPLEAAGVRMGRLVRVLSNGQFEEVIDISAFEGATNPDGTTPDSNPYGLSILSDGAFVADAGANALFKIALDGTMSTVGVFPARAVGPVTVQAVPTTVIEGPDGDLFVGQLTGAPFPVGAANVYRVPRGGGAPVVVASGFTNIIDIAFGANGVGYVLEHDADGIIPPLGPGVAGRLIRVDATGAQTVIPTPGLIKPGGIAIGPDGALYITNKSTSAGTGEVVRLVP